MKYKVIQPVIGALEAQLNDYGKFGWMPIHFDFHRGSHPHRCTVVLAKERDENGFA